MTVFTDIKELLTFEGALQKEARHIRAEDLSPIKNAAIIEDKGLIAWVGPQKNLKKALGLSKKFKEVSLKADCVMPSLVECHTHLIFAGDRKHEFEMRNQGATYQEIAAKGGGIRYTVRETQKATANQLLKLAEERARHLLSQGVTTVEVKSGYGLTEKDEIKILQVAKKIKSVDVVPTYLGAHAIPEGRTGAEYLNEMLHKTLPLIRSKKLAERVDIFIEKNYYSVADAQKYFQVARELGFRLVAHAEQLSRSGVCEWFGHQSGNQHCDHLDSLDHLVQIDDSDIARLAGSSTTCVLLPASDFYLKMKYPPARQLIDAGVRVAISTDYNPGTSPTLSANFVGVLSRLEMKMTLPEVLCAYTLGAAYALHRQNQIGVLRSGYQCDFMSLNGHWTDLFYQVGSHPVSRVVRRGRMAYSNPE